MVNVINDSSSSSISTHSPIKIPNYSRNEQNSYNSHLNTVQNNTDQPRIFVQAIGRKGQNFGEFNGLFDVAVDTRQRRMFVTDYNNHRIQVFDEQGKFLFLFGERGMGDGQFQSPTGIGVGPAGEIIVCERLKGRIQVRNWKPVISFSYYPYILVLFMSFKPADF